MITPEPGLVIAGRYALERPLAKGGMGSIWIAHDRQLEIEVTVKFMAPALVESVEMRTRFEREAKVAARLRSQHVVQVLGYGVEDGMPFIAMELLTGESLADRLTREGRLSLPTVARLLIQIGRALRTAHEAGLVHRDLKPGNIFLALKDEEEVVKILDFGIAKAVERFGDTRAVTGTGMMLGSAHYMSPEQIRSSRAVDHRSDLWSLGVILYRLLTGNLPFPGTTVGDVLVRVCTDTCQPPSWVVPDLPSLLDDFFGRALTHDMDQRFQSAQEMVEAFSAMAMSSPRAVMQVAQPAPMLQAVSPDYVPTERLPDPPVQPPAQYTMWPRPSWEPAERISGPPTRPGPEKPSGADEPTIAVPSTSETVAGTFQAVVVLGSQATAPQGADKTNEPIRAPILWPIWVVAAVVMIGGFSVTWVLLKRGSRTANERSSVAAASAPSSLLAATDQNSPTSASAASLETPPDSSVLMARSAPSAAGSDVPPGLNASAVATAPSADAQPLPVTPKGVPTAATTAHAKGPPKSKNSPLDNFD